jgi:hypothetical protein
MVLACKVLQNQSVVDVYGHVSARLPGDRILSTPHMPPGKVALRDLIVLDMQGKKLEGFRGPTAASVTSVSRKTLSSGTILAERRSPKTRSTSITCSNAIWRLSDRRKP